jgi:four helix bundle protein
VEREGTAEIGSMTGIQRFEDIEAWKGTRTLTKKIYEITGRPRFSRDFALRDQMRRAAVSVVSNIAEGFSRQTDQEFVQFLYIAKGSMSEVQSQLYVGLDLGYLDESEFSQCYAAADQVARLISGFIKYLKGDHS